MRALQTTDLDDAPCGFLIVGDDGRIAAINNTLVSALGYDNKESLIGRSFESIVTIATRIFYQTHLYPLVTLQGRANELFLTFKNKNGDHYPAVCNAIRKAENHAAVIHFIILSAEQRGKYEQEILEAKRAAQLAIRENTDLIEAKRALEQARLALDERIKRLAHINENMAEIGHAISHDIQEPIRKIALRSDTFLHVNRESLSPLALATLRKINGDATQLRAFAVNLEKYVGFTLVREKSIRINLGDLIRQAFLNATRPCDNCSLVFDEVDLPAIEGYPIQLEALFMGLFQVLLQNRPVDQALSITIGSRIEQTNSFLHLEDSYHYIDIVRILVDDNGGLGAAGGPIVEIINRKITIRTITEAPGIASGKAIAANHFGNLGAAIDPAGKLILSIVLPVRQQSYAG